MIETNSLKVYRKLLWGLFAFLAIAVGLYPGLYLILGRNFGLLGGKSEVLLNDTIWNAAFYGHITLGGLALLIGWIQFSKSLRKKRMSLHRKIGMTYFVSVLISSICGIYIGFFADGGIVSSLGFISLGVIWLYTTSAGLIAIKKGNINKHQTMLIYSYAACFAAVMLRIWLPLLITLHQGEFIPAYRIVAWLCWVPNLIVAYFITKKYTPRLIMKST